MSAGWARGYGTGHGRPYLRQLIFFLLAVLLPASALVVLSLRTAAQEGELVRNRARDERERDARHLAQELWRELEGLRREPGAARGEMVMVAVCEGETLRLPWECRAVQVVSAAGGEGESFETALWEAERLEFGNGEAVAVEAAYRRAAAAARGGSERGRALLGMARALRRAGETALAREVVGEVLNLPEGDRDEFGVPLSLYAAAQLAGWGDGSAVWTAAGAAAESEALMSPAALQLARRLVGDAAGMRREAGSEGAGLLSRLDSRLAEAEQARALKSEFRSVRALIESGGGGRPGGRWALYGHQPWLVGVAARETGGGSAVHAVRAGQIAGRIFRERGFDRLGYAAMELAREGEGVWLGEAFPGVRVRFRPGAAGGEAAVSRAAVSWALVLAVLGVTLFGAYLWWRDTRRELKLAAVRSEFVSGVSHELKTPLTSIRMFAETLRHRSPSEAQRREYLETILSESERLSRLLANVLDFSKIERGVKRYDCQPVDLGEVVRSALRAMQEPIREGGFGVELSLPEGGVAVRGDRDALEQALINLIGNAIKYSGEGRMIEVSVRGAGGGVEVVVRDHGVGIHPREHARIFDAYYRAPESHNRRTPGTGLGLSIVRHVAEGHRGRVWVESAPGRGAVFTVWLPAEGA